MVSIKIPEHYIYSADNSHTQRDDEIATQSQGAAIRRFEYDACQLKSQASSCRTSSAKFPDSHLT